MILYDKKAMLDFPRFGITIPALDSRKTKTLDALHRHPELAGREAEWLSGGFDDSTTLEDLLRVNSSDYARGFFDGRAEVRFRTAFELVNPDGTYNRWNPDEARSPLEEMTPLLMKMQAGTWRGAKIALEKGFCHYLGGGTHHGHRDFGHGFCPLNDAALAIRRLQAAGDVRKVWIIDMDAHKGDGSAAIFSEDNSVKTLSIHMARGWPLDGSLPDFHPSWIPSDIDIPIESGEENQYLEGLETGIHKLRDSSTADFVFVLAGADPWEHDELPSTSLLKLTEKQIADRDIMVYKFLEGLGLPSLWLTAGGYGEESWKIHTNFLSWVLPRRL
ncbi:MAG: histone deacetylase [Spirochaetes bacterium]|nr:MAG: histone deacetylase [Spirochaetota bacterium]